MHDTCIKFQKSFSCFDCIKEQHKEHMQSVILIQDINKDILDDPDVQFTNTDFPFYLQYLK